MRLRRPFAAALVTVLVGTGALWATPHLRDWWRERQLTREADAEWRREQAAVDALAAMPLPTGLRACEAGPDALKVTHLVCWQGETEIEPTTIALATNLSTIGATKVSPRCVRPKTTRTDIRVLCKVIANLHGQTLDATVGPIRDTTAPTPHGVQVSGEFLPEYVADSPFGIFSTPLPMPAPTPGPTAPPSAPGAGTSAPSR